MLSQIPNASADSARGGGAARGRAGFTLIEILAVILIVGILATILITQLGSAKDSARIQNTRQGLAMLEVGIEEYVNEFGDAPSSSFTEAQGVVNDGTNVGNEALVVALWSKGWEGGSLADLADGLVNTDADASARALSDFDTKSLLEIPDDWGNPIAYIHRRDYEGKPREYVTIDPDTGDLVYSMPLAIKNPTTGRFYRQSSFQLLSAGPDGRFDTEDDIANFESD